MEYAVGPDWGRVEVWRKESDGVWRRMPEVEWSELEPEQKAELMAAMFGAEARGDG